MSKFGHYAMQYYGNKEPFPDESFLVSGISFYQTNLINITYDSKLELKPEPNNKYDKDAISIIYNNKPIGYVPNIQKYKDLCNINISDNLKIINIKKINGNYGIRVIPNSLNIHLNTQHGFPDNYI
jgi:hypothetical protein